MRYGAWLALAAMLIQAGLAPAQGIPMEVKPVITHNTPGFVSTLVTADDGSVFYVFNDELLVDGEPTGIAVGSDFLGQGNLDFFASPPIAYVEGVPSAVTVHANVAGQDTLSVVSVPLAKSHREQAILLFILLALSDSLPDTPNAFFGPQVAASLFLGFPTPSQEALLMFALWGNLLSTNHASLVMGGLLAGAFLAPLVYNQTGLVVRSSILPQQYAYAWQRIGLTLSIMAIISTLSVENSDELPPELSFVGILSTLAYLQNSVVMTQILVPAILFTYLTGFPGQAMLERYSLNNLYELRPFTTRLALATGLFFYTTGSLQAAFLVAMASRLTEAKSHSPADFDNSGTVDEADFAHFNECFSYPSPAGGLGAGCADADLDGDGDVDHRDFEAFVLDYETPEFPAPADGGTSVSLSPDYQNAGLAISILAENDPIPGYPDWEVQGFFSTQAGNGTAAILANVTDGASFKTAVVVLNDSGFFTPLVAGEDLGQGPIVQIDAISGINAAGEFSAVATVGEGQTAVYLLSPIVDTPVAIDWNRY